MTFAHEQREALHLLQGISENGTLQTSEAARLLRAADPALVYLVFTWLRNRYGGDHPAAEGVIGRLVALTDASIKAQMREGRSDPVVAWFEEEHGYRDLAAGDFVALIVEKLEG